MVPSMSFSDLNLRCGDLLQDARMDHVLDKCNILT
jgi:hypothetical protein